MGAVSRAAGRFSRFFGRQASLIFGGDRTPAGRLIQGTFNGIGDAFDPRPPEYNYSKLKQDIELSGTAEGDEVPLIMGQNVKVPGALIWIGKVKKKIIESEGGKGGADFSDPKTKTLADCMYLLSENPLQPSGKLRELVGGGFTVWREDDDLVKTFDFYEVTAGTFSGGKAKLTITSEKFGQDLSQFQTGKDLILTDFNADNNGTWRCIKAQHKKNTGQTKLVLKDLAGGKTPVSESNPVGATITQDLPDVKKAIADAGILNGASTQVAPAIYSDFEEFAAGYRGRTCFWMQRLNVLKTGGLFNMQFYVDERTETLTLSEAVDIIMTYRTNLDPSDWDSSQLTGTVRGYRVDGGTSAEVALRPLMEAFDFTYRDSQGKIVFFHRSIGVLNEQIEEDEIGAWVEGRDSLPRPGDLSLRDSQLIPRKVTVSFLDIGNEQQRGTVEEVRFGVVTGHEITVELGDLQLSVEEAREIAQRVLYNAENRGMTLRTSFLPKHLDKRVDDTLDVYLNGTYYPMRIGAIEETDDWLLTFDLHTHANGVPYSAPNDETLGSKDGITNELEVHAFVSAPLFSDHVTKPGFYYACSRTDEIDDWEGATLYKGIPDGSGGLEYVAVETIDNEGVVGYFVESESTWWETPASNMTFIPFMWDDYHRIVIQLINEEQQLESRTDAEVLAGANRLMWGQNEYIAFANVEDLGDGKYALTRIIRGLRNTTWGNDFDGQSMKSGTEMHPDGELCTVTTASGLNFREESINEINTATNYKLVPEGQDPDDVAPFTVDLSPDQDLGWVKTNLAPMTPSWVETSAFNTPTWLNPGGPGEDKTDGQGTTGDITITVDRRTRALLNVFRSQSTPVSEETPQFEIYVQGDGGVDPDTGLGIPAAGSLTNPSYGRLLRTDPNAADPYSVTYTAAQQAEDNWGASYPPGGNIADEYESDGDLYILVYQVSASVGRGPPLFAISRNGDMRVMVDPIPPFIPFPPGRIPTL